MPLTDGAVTSVGGGGPVTTAVASDAAVLEPPAPAAVTVTRSAEPMSAAFAVYVTPVAPAMSAHAAPVASHRCHWIVNVSEPASHVPFAAVSVWPEVELPEIVGSAVAAGGGGGETTGVGREAAVLEPPAPIAVTVTRNVEPTSPAATAYAEAVAPVMSPQPPPVASQRCHCTL